MLGLAPLATYLIFSQSYKFQPKKRLKALAIDAVLTTLYRTQRLTSPWLRAAEHILGSIGRRRALAITLVGLLSFAASASLSVFGHVTKPRVHDEFSYLLAADTFANGRITNPTHPLWIHFESFHIIQQPSYASKYPPAQGLILAAGQVIGGHPMVGVWISTALASAALCWMLLAWMPPWWAILGSLLLALHPGILLKWGQSYWGGAMAIMGGALVFGAVRRIMRRPQVRDALLLGLGLAVLANSRPFEGLVTSLPVAVLLIAWMVGQQGPSFQLSMKRIVLPLVLVLLLAGVAMGYYNLRVTGDPLRMPYQVHEATYAMAPVLLWQRPGPEPSYRHEIIRNHHLRALMHYQQQQTLSGVVKTSLQKLKELWVFYRRFAVFSSHIDAHRAYGAVAAAGSMDAFRPDHLRDADGRRCHANMADAALCGAGHRAGICASRAGDAAPALVAVGQHSGGADRGVGALPAFAYILRDRIRPTDAKDFVRLGLRTGAHTRGA